MNNPPVPGEMGRRAKYLFMWGAILFVAQTALVLGGVMLAGVLGALIGAVLSLPIAALAGYQTVKGLKPTNPGKIVIVFGGMPPIVAAMLSTLLALVLSGLFGYQTPFLPIIAGLVGGYIAYKKTDAAPVAPQGMPPAQTPTMPAGPTPPTTPFAPSTPAAMPMQPPVPPVAPAPPAQNPPAGPPTASPQPQ